MFYKKKKNSPGEHDIVTYTSMRLLKKYEGITDSTVAIERRNGIIKTVYTLIDNKGKFVRYQKGYARISSVLDIQDTYETLKRREKRQNNKN